MADDSLPKATKCLRCFDCRAAHQYQIILINKLWERVGVGPSYRQHRGRAFRAQDILCFACIEKRLTRQLRISDLMACPMNAPWVLRIWMRRFPKYWRTPDASTLNVDYERLLRLFVAAKKPRAGGAKQ